jgi:hypothetical protein
MIDGDIDPVTMTLFSSYQAVKECCAPFINFKCWIFKTALLVIQTGNPTFVDPTLVEVHAANLACLGLELNLVGMPLRLWIQP